MFNVKMNNNGSGPGVNQWHQCDQRTSHAQNKRPDRDREKERDRCLKPGSLPNQ